ncbi:MAG: RsmE family RNA methyltransferase [Candidatus Sulfotelmatobacter sp.]
MTRRRWIADEVSGNRAALTGEHAAHLIRVLRARVGQEFDIATGTTVRRGTVVSLDAQRVEFELGEEVTAAAATNISLLLSVFKFDRMEWAIEKCTELGVARIVPVLARRTETHLAFAAAKRVERWRKIALQAAEQSRRTNPPEIDGPIKLKQALTMTADARIVLAETEQEKLLRDVISTSSRELLLAIGPEGGWADDELRQFQAAGWIAASLGPTILRAETAAIAGVAIATSVLAS